MKNLVTIAGISMLLFAGACSHEAKWKVEGNVEGGAGKTVYLQSSQNGVWSVLDSIEISANGKFTLSSAAPVYPAIYRLEMDGKFAYLPIDSIETITFSSDTTGFGTSYKLDGSPDAQILTRANELIVALSGTGINSDSIKRLLGEQLLIKPAGAAAYYVINSTKADGTPIFNPSNKMDVKILGAVANAFLTERPSDPRTKIIERTYIMSKAATMPEDILRAKADSINAIISNGNEVGYFDIDLKDANGNVRKLSESVGKGPVVLNFTVYSAEYGPALNLILGELYNKYNSRGLEIYQVGFDSDGYEWRNVARNLPWIAVHNTASEGTQYLIKYNTVVPMSFIINAQGELVERISDPQELEDAIKRHL